MGDDEALARVAQLEKEKRQRDFQYSALESLLKKTKAENEGLKTKLVAAEAAAAEASKAAEAQVQGPEAAEAMQKLSEDMMTLQVAHLYIYMYISLPVTRQCGLTMRGARASLQEEHQKLQHEHAALRESKITLEQQVQAAPSAETVAALEQEKAALLAEKASLDELVKAAPSAEAMAAHILKSPLYSNVM